MTIPNTDPPAAQGKGESATGEPPVAGMFRLMNGYLIGRSLHVAAQLGVADVLGGGPRTAAEIAAAVQADPDALARLLRALASVGVFAEVVPGAFALTPVGDCLRGDAPVSLRAYARLFGSEVFLRAFAHFLPAVQIGRSGFEQAFDVPLFAYLDADPGFGALYDTGMLSISALQNPAVVAAYDFSGMQTIVDVGGGQGALLRAILTANPAVQGILFDRPRVVDGAQPQFAAAGLAERCTTVGGDMFEGVPAGADAYIIKNVFMDLDDAEAVTVLRNVQRAMAGQGRVLVIDPTLPEEGQPSPNPFIDLVMLVMSPKGRCRTPTEVGRLLAQAGFDPQRVLPTAASESIIEGSPRA